MCVLSDERYEELSAASRKIEEICEEFNMSSMELLWVVTGIICTRFHYFVEKMEKRPS